MEERLAVAGAGAIACGLAATAARHGPVLLWARSEASAQRARETVDSLCGRLSGEVNASHVKVVTDLDQLGGASFIVEAVVEDHEPKADLLAELGRQAGPDAIVATTTSALSIEALGEASGHPDRFVGLHVFNPVTKMKLVELAFPAAASDGTRERARGLCQALGKTPVEVPDIPGFVVNRLLFPYLFNAVRLYEQTGLSAPDMDTCMTLGAGHPLGPLGLLDLVGLDVAEAIGEAIEEPVPDRVRQLVAEGALGRKTGRGFYSY
jgi:3-hydroxybutyryl-CoA dehydrogenase